MRAQRISHVARLSPDERAILEAGLARQVVPWVRPGVIVARYAVHGAEINPAAAAPHAALPWFADRDAPMRFRLGPATQVGPFGICQPAGDAPEVQPAIVLAPLLAVTAAGARLGMGAGHYDRWAAALPRRKAVTMIGCAWDFQLIEAIPQDPWDMALDAVATPTRLVRCR